MKTVFNCCIVIDIIWKLVNIPYYHVYLPVTERMVAPMFSVVGPVQSSTAPLTERMVAPVSSAVGPAQSSTATVPDGYCSVLVVMCNT